MKHVHEHLYIDGRWEPRGVDTIDVVEASTEELIGQAPEASTADLDEAVARARAALQDPDGWGGRGPEQRAGLLGLFAAAMAERGEDFAQLVGSQNAPRVYPRPSVLGSCRQRRDGEVVDTLTDIAAGAVVGNALDESTMIGPMARATYRDRVECYIRIGKAQGARMTTGGGRPSSQPQGWFVEPTVIADVDNDATIAREEIFGRVPSVIAHDDVDDTVRTANEAAYGLGGTVWTRDLEHGLAAARWAETGSIGVNAHLPDPVASFGGVEDSGIGREVGAKGLATHQQLTSIDLPAEEA